MKKILFVSILLLNINTSFSQTKHQDTLYLFVDTPDISFDFEKNYSFIFIIPSNDKRFKCDSYTFSIPNQKDFDEKYQLSEITKKIERHKMPEKNITRISSLLTENAYTLHERLSLAKNIFLVYNNPNDKNYYNLLTLFYMGTQKNVIPNSTSKM